MSKRLLYLLCMALACAVFVAACGDDDDGGGGGGGTESGATEGAKAIDPASMDSAKGDVTFCIGKDTGRRDKTAVKTFNAQNNGVKVDMLEFSTSADEQRTQFVQRQEAKSGECDVFSSDVIWTAEFASQKWLYDMTPYVETRKDELIEATLETVTYDGKTGACRSRPTRRSSTTAPTRSTSVPATWQEVYEVGRPERRHRLPGRAVRGPDLRLPRARVRGGGEVLSEDGKRRDRLARERQGAPVHGRRRQGRHRRQRRHDLHGGGVAALLRVRPGDLHAQLAVRLRARRAKGSKVKGKFDVAPFPSSRAAARPASSAATTWSSRSTRRTRAAR